MKIAYFDCQFGAAGDMLNAALLAAGVDETKWRAELKKVGLPEESFSIHLEAVMRCGVAAKKMSVLDAAGISLDSIYHGAHGDHAHEGMHSDHAHAEAHGDHAHAEAHGDHAHEGTHGHHAHTGLGQILDLIERSSLSFRAKQLSGRIFTRLAIAESAVHNVSPDAVQFHEVGAVDAIVDIIGFSIGYDMLGIEKSFCSPLAIGSGKAQTEHGLYPVPGPATAYLLQQASAATACSAINFECLTPTGAAILCEIASEWGVQPAFSQLNAVGYGAGSKDPAAWPNVCRVLLGESNDTISGAHSRFDRESVVVMEANLDDLSPQAIAFAMERLFEAGALDVSVCPALMKKGRSGHLLAVICRPADRQAMEQVILTQTSTIGVRFYEASRSVARRQWLDVRLPTGGGVRIKVAKDAAGEITNVQPEYEDCAAYAAEHNLPLKDVINQAIAAYLNNRN